MKKRLLNNEGLKEASLYITAAVVCVLILCIFLRIWRADLRVPFYYTGDSIYYAMVVKGIIENGWYWQNPSVGAPGGLLMYDFPGFDNAVGMLLLLISVFTRNPFLVMNLFYLLSFPLITLTSLYVFRQFNFSYLPALACSLLYAFLPYHFMRNETHLILSAYYVVPLAILVVLWVIRDDLTPRVRKKFILSLLVCILLGSSSIYYPFFFCFLLLVAGAMRALNLRRFQPLAMALLLVGLTSVTVAINFSPSFVYTYRHGDVGAAKRGPQEAETYGLKISQLILPVTGHRIHRFDDMKRFHNANSMISENDTASLGIVGSIGFLALLAQLLRRKELVSANGLFHDLSVLNVAALLLATIGGFGILFSLYISSGIRCYNRISVYISFFSLMAVALLVESIYRRTSKSPHILYLLIGVVFIIGFLDETTKHYVPAYAPNKTEFVSDREFVNSIEASVPSGAMIFQLPYIQFPEYPSFHKMVDYDHFRAYVHSKNLRWSYGTIKNRDGDRAQQNVAALPAEELVQRVAFAGFSGIYVDRFGYEDGGATKQAELSNILQTQPSTSPNGRLLFFNLAGYAARLRTQYSDSEWKVKQGTSFYPVLLDWKGGFSGFEMRPGKTWRWCSSEGELHLRNLSQVPRTVQLDMAFATGYEQLDDFIISGLISEKLKVNFNPLPYSKTIKVPPGDSVITFRSAAKRVHAPLDTRYLVFRIEDFKMTELQ